MGGIIHHQLRLKEIVHMVFHHEDIVVIEALISPIIEGRSIAIAFQIEQQRMMPRQWQIPSETMPARWRRGK